MQDNFRSILVIATRQLGDMLLTTPLIHAARERWPQARIDVLGFAGTLGLLRGNADVNEFIEVREGSGWRESLPLMRRLWRRYDLALIAQYSDRAHLYGWIAARVRSGLILQRRALSWWKRPLLTHAVVVDQNQTHAVLEKLKLLAPWCDVAQVSVRPPPPRALPPDIAAALRPCYVVLHVPSLVAYKQWPLAHAAQLATALADRGRQVVLSGSASSADREMVGEVMRMTASSEVIDAAGRLDLNQVTTLLQGAALYIGPDTSITHLAAACGTPVLALFGPVAPTLWGPWPQGHAAAQPYAARSLRQQVGGVTVLQGPQACVPCNRAGCDNHVGSHSECLVTMLPQRVLAQAMAILERPSTLPGFDDRA